MFCPKCGTEYRQDFTRCADCDVELVGTIPEDKRPLSEGFDLEVVWRGGDVIAFSRVLDALGNADIVFIEQATHDHFVFGIASPRPMYVVRVCRRDYERALDTVAPIQGRFLLRSIPSPYDYVVENEGEGAESEEA